MDKDKRQLSIIEDLSAAFFVTGGAALVLLIFFHFLYKMAFQIFLGFFIPNDDEIAFLLTDITSTILFFGGGFLFIIGIITLLILFKRERQEMIEDALNNPKTEDLVGEKSLFPEVENEDNIPQDRPKIILKGLSPKQWLELKEKGFSRSEALDFIKSGVSDSNDTLKKDK